MSYLTTTDLELVKYLVGKYINAVRTPMEIKDLVRWVGNMDCCNYLRLFPDNSVDFILTDEPYGVAPTHINLKARNPMTTNFEWDKMDDMPKVLERLLVESMYKNEEPRAPMHILNEWVFEAARVLKDGGALVNFGMSEFGSSMRDISRHAGLHWRASGPWIKTNPSPAVRKVNLRSAHEQFFVMSKGSLKGRINFLEQSEMVNYLMDTVCPNCGIEHPVSYSYKYDEAEWMEGVDWFEYMPLNGKKYTNHPTEKPEWLLTKFIKIYTKEGDLVLDCFSGSGSSVYVANKLGREWAANDMSKEWHDVIEARMSKDERSLL